MSLLNEENKNNFNSFPCNNNYTSIRKEFSDINNGKKVEKKGKKIKVKLPKNFEIKKRKINFVSFQELANKINKIKDNPIQIIDGCCCKRYKNGKIK